MTVKMIGREEEQAAIQDCMHSGRPEFVTVYGRLRVGKTFLIREFFSGPLFLLRDRRAPYQHPATAEVF